MIFFGKPVPTFPDHALAAFVCVFVFGFSEFAAGQGAAAAPTEEAAITIAGNRHVDAAAIRSHFHAGRGGRLDAAALDAALKSLYATGLFRTVHIVRDRGGVVVTVAENPTIDRTAFEGNNKIKDGDLKAALRSKPGGPLSRAVVHDDVERIVALYRQRSYFAARVEPQTIKRTNDRVSLVFAIKEGQRLAVRQVLFVGNDAYSAGKLQGAIKTREAGVLSFLTENDGYDADRIESDVAQLRRFYLAHGYADVRVRSAADFSPEKNGAVVTFTIDEGRQYRLGRVDIQSKLKAVDAAALAACLHTQGGDVYDADAVQKSIDDASVSLAKSGQPFAAVTARSIRVPERALIDLVYTVDAGKRLYVERIDIHGNSKTRDAVIRRAFDIGEGDAYNRALLDRGERRLRELGDFKSVKVGTAPGSAPDRVVVDVTVEEQKTGVFYVSGGYSAAAGPSATLTVGDANFLGTGDVAKASATIGQYERGFDLSFTDPYALGPRLSLGVDLFGKETLAGGYQSYDSAAYGARISAGTPLNDQLGMSYSYAIYNQRLTLDPALGAASLPIQQAAAAGPLWVSSIGTGITYTTLDNARNPTDGVRIQTSNELAGLGGAAKFARTNEDTRYYQPLGGDAVGMVRAQTGYVTPWGGRSLPLLDGFFGGPQLVRGFAPNGFGPRDITAGTTQDNVGGNIYWTTSAELQAPLPLVSPDAQLKMALFSDAGSLWATQASSAASLAALSPSQQIANSRAIRAAAGASLIWDSMFGPIRVDYAYPFAHQSYDVTQRLNFSAGGF